MKFARFILLTLIRLYRWVLSPAKLLLFGPLGRCRFTPSCSEYALEAVQNHGALLGVGLTMRRICRCHPWGGCGSDPVPRAGVSSADGQGFTPLPSAASFFSARARVAATGTRS